MFYIKQFYVKLKKDRTNRIEKIDRKIIKMTGGEMKRAALAILLMAGMIFAYAPKDQGIENMPKFFQGKVRIRLTEQAKSSKNLLVKERDVPYSKTGISSIDAKNELIKASSVKIDIIEAKNKELAKKLGLDRWLTIEIPEDADVMETVKLYKTDPNIDIAQPEICYYIMATPNDPYFDENWGHNNTAQLPQYNPDTSSHSGPGIGTPGFDTDAQSGWNGTQGYGSPDVVLCIMDTGIDYNHPDLADHYIGGYDFGMGDDDPIYDAGISIAPHGTNCSGVAAGIANNGIGVTGVAGNCSIMMVKVSTTGGVFNGVANGTIWAADNGADVISMSFGSPTAVYGEDPVYDAAIEYAYNAGVTLLASTGNYGTSYTKISAPANHPNVIAVGAAAPEGVRKSEVTSDIETWWSSMYDNYAPQDDMNSVDILAPTIMPATDITGSDGYSSGDYFEFFNGTSASCPYAAGFAALIKSKYPSYTPAQVRQLMVSTARDIEIGESSAGWDFYSGYGMVDIGEALGYIPTTPPGTPTLVSPLNSGTIPDPTPTFDWQDNPETASYNLLVDNNSDFSSPEINETVVPSQYTPGSNLAEGIYYWKVQANNVAGSSPFTSAWSIELIYADIDLDPVSVTATAPPGSTDDQIFNIENTSTVQLDYSLSVNYINSKEYKGSGGPDSYGYEWEDSDEIGGPVYDWVEISTLGNALNLGDEDESASLNLGFTFNYYGVDYTSIVVGSNGIASFIEDDITYENTAIPTISGERAILAVFWDDLDPGSGGQIYSYQDAANDRFIIEWNAVPDYIYGGGGNPNTFQAIIHRTGKIVYQYKDMVGILDECTVGIGDPTGTDGSLVTYNSGYLKNGLRIEFMAVPEWITLSSNAGSINGTGSDQITITCDAADLDLGTYSANIMIASNDPDESTKILPVTFEVAYGATGGSFALDHTSLSYGGVGVGSSSVKTFQITNGHSTETMLGQITTIEGYFVYPPAKEAEKNVLDYTIAPNSSKTFSLSFEPSAEQSYNGSITVTSSDPANPTKYIAVTGAGTFPEFGIPFSQDFNASTSLPPGWTIADHQGNGQVWAFGTHPNGISGAGGNYAFLNSDSFGSGNAQNADLVTPSIDMSNASAINLSFKHYYNWVGDDRATLSYSIDGGSSWVQIQQWTSDTANPATFSRSIPELDGQSDVRIKWNYTGSYDWFWDVDDVLITGTITALGAPSNLTVSSATASQLNLTWDSVSGASLYRIYRSTDPYSGFLEIATSGTNSYTDQNLSAENKYFYYITADSVKMRE